MRNTVLKIFILSMMLGCRSSDKRETKRIGDDIVESHFINDSILDGPTIYFDLNHRLRALVNYVKGKKHGPEIIYYSNGEILDSSNYEYGRKNGLHYNFDSTGFLSYRDYYFFGQQVGEQMHFKKNNPFQYIFSSFEKKNLFACEYDSIGMRSSSGEIINVNLYHVTKNGRKQVGLFLYMVNPPTVQIVYNLGTVDTTTNSQKKLTSFDNRRMFIDTVVDPPPPNCKYFISADYTDFRNNIQKVYFMTLDL